MKHNTCTLYAISLITIVLLAACSTGKISEALPTPVSSAAPEVSPLIMSTTESETATPIFLDGAATVQAMSLAEATILADTSLPENTTTSTPPSTNVFSIDNTLILYTMPIMTNASPSPVAATTDKVFEATPENATTADTLLDFWALRMLPNNLFPEQAVFDIFYGEVAKTEDISRYFFNFRPQISPNGRYMILSGIGGYPHPHNDLGTGLWLFDLQDGIARQLLPQAKIATWNSESDKIAYVEGDTVYTLSIDAESPPLPLFSHSNLNWLYARWSTDGQWIAAVTSEPDKLTDQGVVETKDTYWIIPVNGEPARKLAENSNLAMEHIAGELAWSYDSQFLLIRNEVFNLAGEKVSPSYLGQVYWLPNEPLLLINSEAGLHFVSVAGEDTAKIGSAFASAWSFSHSGQQLAYTQMLDNEQMGIYIFDMETKENQLIGSTATNFIDIIRWSANDQYLLMDDGQARSPIWVMNLVGTIEQVFSSGVLIEVISFSTH